MIYATLTGGPYDGRMIPVGEPFDHETLTPFYYGDTSPSYRPKERTYVGDDEFLYYVALPAEEEEWSQRVEYRVRWKREGRNQTTRIYQKWDSAYRKAQGVLALDAAKDETSFWSLPDLEEGPVIESRPVGDWEATQVQCEGVGEYAEKAMAQWAEDTHPRSPTREDLPF